HFTRRPTLLELGKGGEIEPALGALALVAADAVGREDRQDVLVVRQLGLRVGGRRRINHRGTEAQRRQKRNPGNHGASLSVVVRLFLSAFCPLCVSVTLWLIVFSD